MDIIPDDGMVTLTRKFTGSRSISRINGETVNTGKLKEAAELLIDIHGQHDNKTLLQRKNHLVLLDLFGRKEIAPIKSEMSKCYKEYRAICKKAEETSLMMKKGEENFLFMNLKYTRSKRLLFGKMRMKN